MKYSFLIILNFVSIFICSSSSCNKDDDRKTIENSKPMTSGKIKITVNSQTFTATLLDNNSAKAFKEMLPVTIDMAELNRNEKYYDLPNNLPTNASVGADINAGDLMLYGSNTLVLFYKSFNTSYSYTKLGTIDNPSGIAAALGTGNVVVTFDNH